MKGSLPIAVSIILACSACMPMRGQSATKESITPPQLTLTAEIAATTDDGNPAALRVTLTNNGNTAVTLPVLSSACSPTNGVTVAVKWIPDDPTRGGGGGGGCAGSPRRSLAQRVEQGWIRLHPGEYMTTTLSLRDEINSFGGPGTLEYWVEYTPPQATRVEISSLLESGYIIPTEKLQTQHQCFRIR